MATERSFGSTVSLDRGNFDLRAMRAALAVARRGLGSVWPNPAVGCVIANESRVVGRGWTQPGGRPHGETEVPSDMVGELVMEALSTLDQVAYIRFASVYRNFREAKDFGEFVGRIAADDD